MRVNNLVRAPLVRLIGADGSQLGIVPVDQARKTAREAGMDLVEVAPNADPPVCRVMDYGKFKYQQAKKAQEAKKKQVQTQLKEIKFRPKIADHDFNFKVRKIQAFLEERNRVKVTVQFQGQGNRLHRPGAGAFAQSGGYTRRRGHGGQHAQTGRALHDHGGCPQINGAMAEPGALGGPGAAAETVKANDGLRWDRR